MEKIRLGISSCLLGESVRYDGSHKRDRFLTDVLGEYMEYVPVCPEVECGLPVPREAMHLEGSPDHPRLVTSRTRRDMTERMVQWAQKRVAELEKEDLCGFIFKANSPSSGMERVKIYDKNNIPSKKGVGVFAGIFMRHFPLLPAEEEGRLHDAGLRENFVERIFVFQRWRDTIKIGQSLDAIIRFHTKNKLLILSHGTKDYRMMGKLVAKGKELALKELYSEYQTLLMQSLKLRATVKKNVNVLYHLMGYFKKDLTSDEKKELIEIIEEYHKEYVPLIVPITLINHYVRKYDQPYLRQQYYLHPHPLELKLRNHV